MSVKLTMEVALGVSALIFLLATTAPVQVVISFHKMDSLVTVCRSHMLGYSAVGTSVIIISQMWMSV